MKRRNELNMKPAAVIHMLSPRNFKIGSYTRSPHVGGLATVSRHPAVVHAGGGLAIAYIYIYILYSVLVLYPDNLLELLRPPCKLFGKLLDVSSTALWLLGFRISGLAF